MAVLMQSDLCKKRLRADRVVDYLSYKEWWAMPEYQENPFHVVDMVNGDNWTIGGLSDKAIKHKGNCAALMSVVETETLSMWGLIEVFNGWNNVVYQTFSRKKQTMLTSRSSSSKITDS